MKKCKKCRIHSTETAYGEKIICRYCGWEGKYEDLICLSCPKCHETIYEEKERTMHLGTPVFCGLDIYYLQEDEDVPNRTF